MKKIRWRRLFLVIVLFLGVAVLAKIGMRWAFEANVPLSTATFKLPDAPRLLQDMNSEEQASLIEQARRDAVAAAKSVGQSESDASKFGDKAVESAKAAISRPVTVVTETSESAPNNQQTPAGP